MTQQVLITGATGQLGKAVVEFLLKKGVPAAQVHVLVRDKNKAAELEQAGVSLHYGDYDDYASLVKAFSGIDKLLLVSGNDFAKRAQQQYNAVKAAKEAGVKHILYTSFDRRNETASSPISFVAKTHLDTEEQVRQTGIPYTILRNGLYMDMLPIFAGEQVLQNGIYFPADEGRTAFATRSNMAEAAANILASEGHENKEYVFANTANYSFGEVAEVISGITGKPVTYTGPAYNAYVETVTGAGMPNEYATMFGAFGEAIRQGEFENTSSDLEKILGRAPVTLKEYLAEVYGK